jgi:hypothetical protein
MQGDFCRNALKSAVLAASVLCLFESQLRAQESAAPAASNQTGSNNSADVRTLTASILELQSQIKSMNDQLLELRKEQDRSREEARELRKRLEQTQSKGPMRENTPLGYDSNAVPPGNAPAPSTNSHISPAGAGTQGTEDRISRMEENADFLDAKINEQYQTKVESGSKYRLRLSGIVLLNVFANRGAVDNVDFPQLAQSPDEAISGSSFGASLRQSQISLQGFGPDIAGAHTSADLKLDFAGSFPSTPNGITTGAVRLRTGTVRMDWAHTSLVAGQDRLFFAPLSPSSLATLATPALSYNGNLWNWTPQVRLEHTVSLSESSSLILQGGILDSLTGELPASEYNRSPTSGEASGQPAYAARVALRQKTFGQQWTLGFGGYYARQNWGLSRNVDSWASTTDLLLPLGKYFEFSGEFYRGRSVGGLGGGIGQSVLLSGSATDPATIIKGLDSMGGWAQLKFKPKSKLEFNGAFGQDNPFASQLRLFPFAGSYFDSPQARNRSALINFIYQVRSNFLLSLEYRRLRTIEIEGDDYQSNHINLSLGYIF